MDLKPGDFLICDAPDEGLERDKGYTVRSVPKPGYVSIMETAPEVFWQQSRFTKITAMHKPRCACPQGKNFCLLPDPVLRSGDVLE